MPNPKISIIVPVYNLENYIEKTIEQLISQTYKNLEIILVDDGSTDKSLELCNTFAKRDNRILVVHQKNQGVSVARNTGIKHATGEYIGFFDGDDDIESDIFEFLYNNLVKNNADISICGVTIVNPDNSVNNISTGKQIIWNTPQDYIKALFKGTTTMNVYTKLFKAEICKNTLFPTDLRTNEDKFYCFTTALKANRICLNDISKYTYYRRAGSATVMNFTEKFFDSIKSSDMMVDICKEQCPEILNNAHANKLATVLRTYKLMILRNGLKAFPKETDEIKTYIKNFDKSIAKNYLSKKNYIRYKVAKTSHLLFAFMSRHLEKS